ncbi:MAG: ABC transporter permease [Planctomycetota bacterium]
MSFVASGFPMLLRELSVSAAHAKSRRVRLWCAIGQFLLAGWFLLHAKSGDGSRLFAMLVGAEFAIIYALLPALIANAVAGERERESLDLLLVLPISRGRLLLQRLLSRLVPLLALLSTALPGCGIAYGLGGLETWEIARGGIAVTICAFEVAALALWASCRASNAVGSMIQCYGIAALLHVGAYLASASFTGSALGDAMGGLSPVLSYYTPNSPGGTQVSIFDAWPALALGAGFLIWSRVRFGNFSELRAKSWFWGVLLRTSRDLPGNSPIAWLESRRFAWRSRFMQRLFLFVMLPVVACGFIAHDMDVAARGFRSAHLGVVVFCWQALSILIVLAASTGLIANERRRETLEVLLTTPLHGRRIAAQKFLSLRSLIVPIFVPNLILFALLFHSNRLAPSVAAPFTISVIGFLFYTTFAWFGFLYGCKCPSQPGAMIRAFAHNTALWVLNWFGLLIFLLSESGVRKMTSVFTGSAADALLGRSETTAAFRPPLTRFEKAGRRAGRWVRSQLAKDLGSRALEHAKNVRRRGGVRSLLLLAILAAFFAPAHADVTAQLEPITQLPRGGGPIPVRVEIRSTEPAVLTGRLVITADDATMSFESTPLTVPSGKVASFRLTLPALCDAPPRRELVVKLELHTATRKYNLGTAILAAKTEQPCKVIGYASAWPGDSELRSLLSAMRIDLPMAELAGKPKLAVRVSVVRLLPEEWPRTPAELCAYDVTIVHGAELAALGKQQREALRIWVRAGGVLCLLAPNTLGTEERDFIQSLAASNAEITLVPGGTPRVVAEADQRFHAWPAGLGLFALITGDAHGAESPTPAKWREISFALWRLRDDVAGWVLRGEPVAISYDREDWQRDVDTSFAQLLSPPEEAGVPGGLLVFALLLYVFAVSPLSTFLVRRFDAPALVWLLTPVWGVVFLAITATIASAYLGVSMRNRCLRIIDVDTQGNSVREHRFEMRFAQEAGSSTGERTGSLVCPARPPALRRPNLQYQMDDWTLAMSTGQTRIAGAFPENYEIQQVHRKWTVQLNHELLFADSPPPSLAVSWQELASLDPSDERALTRAFARIEASGRHRCFLVDGHAIRWPPGSVARRSLTALWHGITYRAGDLFERTAPNASGDVLDLYLVSEQNQRDRIVIVAIQDPSHAGDWVVYRCWVPGT